VSRRSPRIRARLTVTVQVIGADPLFVCQTRDVSREGLCLDTGEPLRAGLEVSISVMDAGSGEASYLLGVVTRVIGTRGDGAGRGAGIRLPAPPDEWIALVTRLQLEAGGAAPHAPPVRLRILVVGDEQRRRSALALYVTSGWDVRFASDLRGVEEALTGVAVDAIIAEHDVGDAQVPAVLDAARRLQPRARRIVRSAIASAGAEARAGGLVHRVVDIDAGLDALVDALTADLGEASPAPRGPGARPAGGADRPPRRPPR
jgi:hypothetical protein